MSAIIHKLIRQIEHEENNQILPVNNNVVY